MTDKPELPNEQPNPAISDEELSDLYRAMSTEQAPQSMDAAILQMAKQNQSVQSTPFSSTSVKTWVKSWAVPVSVAAVIVLSVSIVTTIDFRSPDTYRLPDTTSSSKDNSPLSREQNNSTIDSLTEPEANNVQNETDSNLPAPMANKPSLAKKTEKAYKAKPSPTKRDDNLMANQPFPVTRATAFDETISLDEPALSERKEQRQPSEKTKATNSLESSMVKEKPTQPSAPNGQDRKIAVTPKSIEETALADEAEQSTQVTRAKAPADTRRMFSNTPNTADFSASLLKREAQSKAQPETQPNAQAFTLNQAKTAPPPPEQSSGAKTNTQINSQTTDCESLTHSQCLSSLQCVLKLNEKELQCRRAENQCEKNFRQQIDSAAQCATKSDCQYRAGSCKCDVKNGQCDCGDIGPSTCQLSN